MVENTVHCEWCEAEFLEEDIRQYNDRVVCESCWLELMDEKGYLLHERDIAKQDLEEVQVAMEDATSTKELRNLQRLEKVIEEEIRDYEIDLNFYHGCNFEWD